MDHDERALAARQRQDVQHLPVVQLQQVVGHVHLERGVPVADQRRQFLAHDLLRRVGNDQVKGVVDDRLRAGGLVVFLDDLPQRLAAMLGRERDHRRRPAKRRRDSGAVEIIGADHSGRGTLLNMAVAVDAARQHEPTGCIDLARAPREILAEGRNDTVLDGDVTGNDVGGRSHGAVADHQIVFAHAAPLLLSVGRALL